MEWNLQGSVCLIGDIHGVYYSDLTDRFGKVADNYIFLGDIGFGFERVSTFIKGLDADIPEGVECYFIRGNHDDPSCWKGRKAQRIEHACPRFHMVKDYDTIRTKNGRYLCIGGGISIDRHYRVEGKSYWSDEHILSCPKKNTISEIDGIFSHTGFTPPVLTHKHDLQMRFADVNQDCQDEQRVLYEILALYHPKTWYCGHYHVSCCFDVKGCACYILNCYEHKLL